MFKCRLTHEDSTRVPLLAPFTIDLRVVRVGDASTSITVSFDGNTNIVLSYQDFKLYMAITNTWFTAMREIKVPTGSTRPKEGHRAHVGLIDASQAVVMQAASPLTKSKRQEAAAAAEEQKKDVKEVLLLHTGTLDLTLINDCYGVGSDKVHIMAAAIVIGINRGFSRRTLRLCFT